MTDAELATDRRTVERPSGLVSRLPSPASLALLFFLGLPGLVVPSLSWTKNFFLFGLFGLWPMVRGFLPSLGDEDPTGWIEMGTDSALPSLLSVAYVQLNPFVQWIGLRQMVGQVPVVLRYHFRLPAPGRFDQTADYRLPVEGEWTVVNGGPTRRQSHSWGLLAQRYAYDLVVTDEAGCSHDGDGDRLAEYHCYGEPVVAPADGVVVAASDGHRDYGRPGGWLDPRQRDIRGNWVVVEHAGGEHSVLAHLQDGSVRVSPGDRVERGERLGRCGNSGNSTEPHLHFHVQDRASFYRGMGLPVRFDDVTVRTGEGEVTAHDRTYLRAGQRVAPRTE